MGKIIKELNLDMVTHAAGFRQRWEPRQVCIITFDGDDIGWLQSMAQGDTLFLAQLFVDASVRDRASAP